MGYLKREERRHSIVEAAVAIVETQGLSALSVRTVAGATGASQGHVHHHFKSFGDLRVEAFTVVSNRHAETLEKRTGELPPSERLRALLSLSEDDYGALELRFWNEATQISRSDEAFRVALNGSLRGWAVSLSVAIEDGKECGDFSPGIHAGDTAMRLIALCLGLDELRSAGTFPITLAEMNRHTEALIELEVRRGA